MSKRIELTNGQFAIVDDEDYEYLSQFTWHNAVGYARRSLGYQKGGSKYIYMHQEIMKTPKGMVTDHINRDRLDNRRENLRICTESENARNYKRRINKSSGYTGVNFNKTTGKFQAQITLNRKNIHLGVFECKHEAARAYNEAAIKYHGEFAHQNIIKEDK